MFFTRSDQVATIGFWLQNMDIFEVMNIRKWKWALWSPKQYAAAKSPRLAISPSWCLYAQFIKCWLIYPVLDETSDGRLYVCPREPGVSNSFTEGSFGKARRETACLHGWRSTDQGTQTLCKVAGPATGPVLGSLVLPLPWQFPMGPLPFNVALLL